MAQLCTHEETGSALLKLTRDGNGHGGVILADDHIYADGNFIFRYDKGPVFLIEATPEAFKIKGKLEPPKGGGPAWPHPVIHDGKLYLRHKDILLCYDVCAKK